MRTHTENGRSTKVENSTLPLSLALAGLLVVIGMMAGVFRDRIEPGLLEQGSPEQGDVYVVERSMVAAMEPVPASVEARETTIVASRLLARVETVSVRAGDYVEQGQLLATLDQRDLEARVRQAQEGLRAVEARLTEAQQSLARAIELQGRQLLSDADLDAARAAAQALAADKAAAEQALVEARTALSYAEIRSPLAGRIVERFAEPGDTVSPGAQLLSLYNPGSLRVEAWVRESVALTLSVGQALTVEIPALEQVLSARIEEIVPAADPGSRAFRVKALLGAAPGLLPGMYARVDVPRGERSVLLVPRDRVASVGQLDVAWVQGEGGATRRFLRLGESPDGEHVEVIAGLDDGDRLLMPPTR